MVRFEKKIIVFCESSYILWICQLLTRITFVLAWDKSYDSWVNSQEPITQIYVDGDTTTIVCFEKQYTICVLTIRLIDRINKVSDQNSHILKMKLILSLLTLAAITSYCSISALKCYKCSEDSIISLSTFCSNTGNSESWEKVDCAGSCSRYTKWKYQKIILSISIQYYFEMI